MSRVIDFLSVIALLIATASFDARAESVEELAKAIETGKTDCFEQPKRETAMRALARMKTLHAAKVMSELLGDPFVHIHELAVKLLGGMNTPEIAAYVSKGPLFDKNRDCRQNAAETLGLMRRPEAVEGLLKALSDRDSAVAAEAARALGLVGDAQAAAQMTKKLPALRGEVKGEALRALGALKALPDEAGLEAFFKDQAWEARAGLLDGCVAQGHPGTAALALKALADKSFQVRIAAVEAVVREGAADGGSLPGALEVLQKGLSDPEWQVRSAAIHASARMWAIECIPILIEGLAREAKSGGGRLTIDYGAALLVYTGKNIGYDFELWAAWWAAQKDKFQLGGKPKTDEFGTFDALTGPSSDEKTEVRFYSLPVLSKRVAFVFDLSGSMKNPENDAADARPKIDVAREKFTETLKKFGKDQWFNVVIYRYFSGFPPATELQSAFPGKLMPMDPARKTIAASFMDKQEPRGWGNFWEGISAAMDMEHVDTIFFLSDGKPSRGRYVTTDGLLRRIREANRFRQVMIHTILTGEKGTDQKFMRSLAAVTWGFTAKG